MPLPPRRMTVDWEACDDDWPEDVDEDEEEVVQEEDEGEGLLVGIVVTEITDGGTGLHELLLCSEVVVVVVVEIAKSAREAGASSVVGELTAEEEGVEAREREYSEVLKEEVEAEVADVVAKFWLGSGESQSTPGSSRYARRLLDLGLVSVWCCCSFCCSLFESRVRERETYSVEIKVRFPVMVVERGADATTLSPEASVVITRAD